MTVMPFEANSCAAALNNLKAYTTETCPFTFWTDKEVSARFTIDHPVTLRSKLAGTEGSILDVYGTGEYEWDKFTIKLHRHRGTDSGVTLRYGKNITDLKKTTDVTNIWTGVCPYWYGTDPETSELMLVTLPEKVVYSNFVDSYAYKMIVPLDLTSYFETAPTEDAMRQKAKDYVANNAVSSIPTTIDVSFIALWQTEDYKEVASLQRLRLCDTLTIKHKKLGVENTAKIVKVVYNVLLERYDSMTIGEAKSTLASTMTEAAEEIKKSIPSMSVMEQAIYAATNLLTGGKGGHIITVRDADGKPKEILAMNTDNTQTATQVLRINMNGIGFSSNGINGPYRSAWTLDGKFVADFITTGTLNAALLKAGAIAGANGKTLIDLDNETINLNGQVTANNNVQITTDGKLKAVNGEFSGKIVSEEGEIGGFKMDSSALKYGSPLTPNNSNQDMNIYLGKKGISVDSKQANSNYYRRRISMEDGKLCVYQDNVLVGYLASQETASDGSYNYRYFCVQIVNGYSGNEYDFLQTSGPNSWMNVGELIIKASAHVSIHGDLLIFGTKSRVAETKDFGERKLYCYETLSPMFGDVGEGKIGADGVCLILTDPVFEETIDTGQYQVFLQKYGDGDCYVSERHPFFFVVTGTPGLSFGWELKAKQAGFSQLRLDQDLQEYVEEKDYGNLAKLNITPDIDYGIEAANYIERIEEERIL